MNAVLLAVLLGAHAPQQDWIMPDCFNGFSRSCRAKLVAAANSCDGSCHHVDWCVRQCYVKLQEQTPQCACEEKR